MRGVPQPLPQTEPLQLLARLEAEEFAVDLTSRAQHNLAQHLDALGLGARVSLEGDMLGQSLYRLLIVPVAWCIAHGASRFLASLLYLCLLLNSWYHAHSDQTRGTP